MNILRYLYLVFALLGSIPASAMSGFDQQDRIGVFADFFAGKYPLTSELSSLLIQSKQNITDICRKDFMKVNVLKRGLRSIGRLMFRNRVYATHDDVDWNKLPFAATQNNFSLHMTPTEAHLIVHKERLSELNEHYIRNKKLHTMAIKVNALQKVAQEQGYYSYVHAQRWSLDLVQKIYEELHPQATNCFFPLHFLTLAEKTIPIEKEREMIPLLLEQGTCPETNYEAHLLSMNGPLFGNVLTDFCSCTIDYIRCNYSMRPPYEILLRLFKSERHADLYTKYESEIKKLEQLHAESSGFGKLWVILVPQQIHRKVVISTIIGGYKQAVIIDGKETEDVDFIQEIICTRPHAIKDLDALQFRMLMTPSTGLNPDTGIKTIPLHCADPVKYAEFEVALKALMVKIKADIAAKKA